MLPFKIGLPVSVGVSPDIESNNILEVQGLLNIDETGILDNKTVDTLKKLEIEYNMKSGTDLFAKLFFNNGKVIQYEDLNKIKNIMNKY